MRNVLILNSYNPGFKWTDDITRGVIAALGPLKKQTRIFIEYMGTKWVKDDLYSQQLRQLLKHKYARYHVDLIISSDNDAFDFLRNYRDEVFGKIPVVFCGVNNFHEKDLDGRSLYTGISETPDLEASIELALRLHPGTKKIFVINDLGISGRKVRGALDKIALALRGRVDFQYEDKADLDKIVADVAGLPADALIFYSFFYGDPAKQSYKNSECISRISLASPVPIYGAWDFNLGLGIVGGKLISGFDQGIAAGRMGLAILEGRKVESIPIIYKSQTRYMFDYRQIARFGIKRSALPEGSLVINAPETFRTVPIAVIWATLLGVGLLSGLLVLLLAINGRRKRSEALLQKAYDELELIVSDRTRDLSELNERLRGDVAARKRTEAELKQTNRELTREVEARKTAEEASSHSVSLLRATIESTNDGILVVDKLGRIVDWNRRFLDMWHISEEVISSRRDEKALSYVLDQLIDPDGFMAKVRSVYSQPESESIDTLLFKDGRIFERSSRPQYLDNRIVGRVWTFLDITERKRMEEEILKAQKLDSLGVLAGGIAHDFNNLLTGILGNISLAKIQVDPAGKAYGRIVEAEKACHLTKSLTSQLLTFSKGGAPIKKVASMPRILMDSAGFVLRGSNARCSFSLPDNLWDVEVDGGQMSQVVNNLIINADQAMPDGGVVTIRAENVLIAADTPLPLQAGRYVHILIRDRGSGIPEEILPKVFDPYFTTKRKGSGLGLASVYSIVMKHDGYVGVESKPGEETTFHLYLPASGKPCEGEMSLSESHPPQRGRGTILLMDDEELIRQTTGEMLRQLGYQVDLCEDGVAAIERYRKALEAGQPYTVVMMDLTIPGGMGGKAAMKKVLEINPSANGIVMSGYSNDPILAHYRDYGFSAAVMKPFTLEELSKALAAVGDPFAATPNGPLPSNK
jgi:PAS domain S-box-containing protein